MIPTSDTLYARLLKAQTDMETPSKDGDNPHFGNKFASLYEVTRVAKAALNANGLFLAQPVSADAEGRTVVHTFVYDAAGNSAELGYCAVRVQDDPQKLGSAITYLRRYSLCAALGIVADEDDDGRLASERKHPANPKTAAAPERDSSPATGNGAATAASESPAGTSSPAGDSTWTRASVGLAAKKAGISPGVLIAKRDALDKDPSQWDAADWHAYAVSLGLEDVK